MPRQKYDPVAFVKAWLESSAVADVALKTGMTTRAAMVFASQLRAKGVKLPKYTGRPIDIAALNALIAGKDGES